MARPRCWCDQHRLSRAQPESATPGPDQILLGNSPARGLGLVADCHLRLRHPVMTRSFPTPPPSGTPLPVVLRSFPTPPARTTRHLVTLRSFPTPPATATLPPVTMRSLTTQPASATSHWAISPGAISLRAITISTSAM